MERREGEERDEYVNVTRVGEEIIVRLLKGIVEEETRGGSKEERKRERRGREERKRGG